jgi:hypothetical protein
VATWQALVAAEPDLPVLAVLPSLARASARHGTYARFAALLQRPLSDCVFLDHGIEEIHFRLQRLWAAREQFRAIGDAVPTVGEAPAAPERASEILVSFVPDLRSPRGRLDARRVGRMFGLNLTGLAAILGRETSAVMKTPDAEALQEGLRLFERIAGPLLHVVGDPERLRMWLNAPNNEFDGQAPLQLVRDGQGDLVAQRLENALSGQPA